MTRTCFAALLGLLCGCSSGGEGPPANEGSGGSSSGGSAVVATGGSAVVAAGGNGANDAGHRSGGGGNGGGGGGGGEALGSSTGFSSGGQTASTGGSSSADSEDASVGSDASIPDGGAAATSVDGSKAGAVDGAAGAAEGSTGDAGASTPCSSGYPPDAVSFESTLGLVPAPLNQTAEGLTGISSALLSRNGRVVAGAYSYEHELPPDVVVRSRMHGYRWTANGFELVGVPEGRTSTSVAGIDCSGSTLVGASDAAGTPTRAVRWTVARGFEDLPVAPATSSAARAVSSDGRIIYGETDAAPFGGMRWRGSDAPVPLPSMPGSVEGMSARGDAFFGTTSMSEAFLWKDDGMVHTLKAPYPVAYNGGRALSPDGQTLLMRAALYGGKGTKENFVLWTAAGGFETVGSVNGFAVSNDGNVVVGGVFIGSADGDYDLLWDRKHGVRHLRSVLAGYGITVPAGWRVHEITHMSDDARVFAGRMLPSDRSYQAQAFRVVLPANVFD